MSTETLCLETPGFRDAGDISLCDLCFEAGLAEDLVFFDLFVRLRLKEGVKACTLQRFLSALCVFLAPNQKFFENEGYLIS